MVSVHQGYGRLDGIVWVDGTVPELHILSENVLCLLEGVYRGGV